MLPSARGALLAAAAAAVVVAVLGRHLAREPARGGPGAPGLDAETSGWAGPLRGLTVLADPALVVVATSVLAVGCALAGRWRAAALALSAPPLAVLATELWLKPLVGWQPAPGRGDAFPSGHATAMTAAAVVVLVVFLPHGGQGLHPVMAAAGGLAVALALGVGVALVSLGYHQTSDVVGGAGVAVSVVLLVAVVVDLAAEIPARRTREGARSPLGRRSRTPS